MADCDELSYASFHDWFEPGFVALLREILHDAIENLDTGRADLNGRLERFRDVLIADATIVSLYQDATDVYAATGDDQAELKLHLTESHFQHDSEQRTEKLMTGVSYPLASG